MQKKNQQYFITRFCDIYHTRRCRFRRKKIRHFLSVSVLFLYYASTENKVSRFSRSEDGTVQFSSFLGPLCMVCKIGQWRIPPRCYASYAFVYVCFRSFSSISASTVSGISRCGFVDLLGKHDIKEIHLFAERNAIHLHLHS